MQRYYFFFKSKIKNQKSKILDCRIGLLAHIGFMIAIALSAWFHELRSTFGESAMTLFNLISEPKFFSSSVWFSIHWFQNLMTILAIKSNLSLSFVSLVFSVSPMVFMYGVFLIANYVFKQKNAGIFLLLLFLGVNQTFFGAVHTPLMSVTTIYLAFVGLRRLDNVSQFDELKTWGFACLLLVFVWVSPNAYSDVIKGEHYFSFFGYAAKAVSVFVISFAIAAYLMLLWIYRKQFNLLILFGGLTVVMMAKIFYNSRHGLLDVNYEILYFPIIAVITGFFIPVFLDNHKQTATRFWIISALVLLAVFGQLRTLPKFQERQNYVVKLLQHTPKIGDKFAVPEHFQQLERYIDPTHLAFETPLIASLRGLLTQSIFFIPNDTTQHIPRILRNTPNTAYFHFFNPNYVRQNTPIIHKTLYEEILIDTMVATGDSIIYALTQFLSLCRGDSLSVSVLRKGSNFGNLIISDNQKIATRLWVMETSVSEADTEGWQKLSRSLIIEKTDKHRVYTMNKNHKEDKIYFKKFHVEIWRE